MAGVGYLLGLALAAVGRSPYQPVVAIADTVAGAPELGSDACIGGVLDEIAQLPVLDLAADLGAELEVKAAVVDAPAPVRLHVDAVFRISDQVL